MAKENLKISVVTVSFNAIDEIEKTILSVLNQTYDNIEYIIIDGGSTDGTVDIIKKYSDKLYYWGSEPDKGIFDAMNKGICVASGDYINFMNAGDTYHDNDVIKKSVKYLKGWDIIGGIAKFGGKRKKRLSYWIPINKKFKFDLVKEGGIVNHQSTYIKLEVLKEEKYFTDYQLISDELYFIKKIIYEGLRYRPIYLIISNYSMEGISNNKINGMRIIKERARFYEINPPNNILKKYKNYNSNIKNKLYYNYTKVKRNLLSIIFYYIDKLKRID